MVGKVLSSESTKTSGLQFCTDCESAMQYKTRLTASYLTDNIIQQQALAGLQSKLTGPIERGLAFIEVLCAPCNKHSFVAKTDSNITHITG